LFVAFIAVLGKQWILYYTRATTWGNIVDRGKERQVKLVGLQKWGLHLIMESLPVMLQFALLLFGVALSVYLWDLNVSIAEVVLVVTSIGLAFYICITVAATIWSDCPFQTPLSILLPKVPPWAKEFTARVCVWLRRRATPLSCANRTVTEHGFLKIPDVGRTPPVGRTPQTTLAKMRSTTTTHDAFKPRVLEARSTFHFPHSEGYRRLRRVLVVGELHRFFGCLRRRRGILRVPVAISPPLHDRLDSTP
jgi:hypothetical protein